MTDRISQALAWCATRTGAVVCAVPVVAAAAWFALPALLIPFSEGFQPQVVLNAHALAVGDPRAGDMLYPFNEQFFMLTRVRTTQAGRGGQRFGGG